jgi:AcrR family transcriptional regulator
METGETGAGARARRGPGRRAPRPEQRQRDAERTRERIVAAAVAEFGEKGYAGARVGEIAARAGVNVQLISYYFGGKAGLYRELTARWRVTAAELSDAGSLAEVVAGFARESMKRRDWTRLMLWDGLTDPPPADDANGEQPDPDGGPDVLLAAVRDLRDRQGAGELPADLDPAELLLALFAAACAPVMLPQIARRLGLDPAGADLARSYPEQISRLVGRLTGGDRPAVSGR